MRLDTPTGPVLYLDGISVSFDGFKALAGLSLIIEPGELRCIIGPNGAGKTTMMDVITGKTRPDTGDAFFGEANDLTALSETEIAELGIGRKFQKPTVFRNHTVLENLELALKTDKGVFHTLGAKLTPEQADRIDQMLDVIGLRVQARRTADLLSHGQKQWLEIGMMLMQEPKLLLLVEHVDPNAAQRLAQVGRAQAVERLGHGGAHRVLAGPVGVEHPAARRPRGDGRVVTPTRGRRAICVCAGLVGNRLAARWWRPCARTGRTRR